MRKAKGAHFAPKKRRTQDVGDTKEFSVKVRHGYFSYFFFTLFVCALLVALAFMILSVDFFGRGAFEKTDATFALAVSESGQAKLSFFGRDYFADVSFLTPLSDALCEYGEIVKTATPKCILLFFESVPKVYENLTKQIGKTGNQIVSYFVTE